MKRYKWFTSTMNIIACAGRVSPHSLIYYCCSLFFVICVFSKQKRVSFILDAVAIDCS